MKNRRRSGSYLVGRSADHPSHRQVNSYSAEDASVTWMLPGSTPAF